MHIVVCDDDKLFVDKITEKLNQILSEYNLTYDVHKCYNGKDLINHCKSRVADIILLDIDMPDISGFDAVKALQDEHLNLSVIFITAHSEYAYQAYDYNPICFVCKTDLTRLNRVMKKTVRKIVSNNKQNRIVHIELEKIIDIDVNNVVYIDTSKHYVIFHLQNDSSYSIRGTISSTYEQLKKHGFILVQHGYIVNCRYIKKINRSHVILSNDKEISMTRDIAKSKEARELYGKFIRDVLV